MIGQPVTNDITVYPARDAARDGVSLSNPLQNRFLAGLGAAEYARLAPHLTSTAMPMGLRLYDIGEPQDRIYFPHDAVISLLTVMGDGAAIEAAVIGREGALGLTSAGPPRPSPIRAVVQLAGCGSSMPATALAQAAQDNPGLRDAIDHHQDALFAHVAQLAACNILHAVEPRLARSLLSYRDRLDVRTFSVTQAALADRLGVQRTTISAVARSLQARRLIRFRRGVVDILDRAGLEATACECHGAVRQGYARHQPGAFDGPLPDAARAAPYEGRPAPRPLLERRV